jgi:hypothetical protein
MLAKRLTLSAVALLAAGSATSAVPVEVTVESFAPANGVAFAPVRFGFGDGTFDAFDAGSAAFLLGRPDIASAPIVTIAEGGSGSEWLPAFNEVEPNANVGSVLPPPGGPFVPGTSSSIVIDVDAGNRFFTFGTMVVPSNDHFLGNDNPQAFEVFDAAGNLVLPTISQTIGQIWDAGSETEDIANGAFIVGATNANRVNENGVVEFNFADLATFDGVATPAGYNFDFDTLGNAGPSAEILRISFAVVPEPASMGLVAASGLGLLRRRRG